MARAAQTAAALYLRISQDRNGEGLGVERQQQDCEALCKRRGWTVVETFVDDDRSAFSGRARPGYNAMLEGLKVGRFGALVAWHPDRLHRSPRELEDFIDVVEAAGASVATCQAGTLDLSTAAGRMTARIVGSVARHESEQKSERLRRQREQAAAAGHPQGGGRRAFGYTASGAEVVEHEAELVREAAQRVLGGGSLRSVVRDWNGRGVRSSSGKDWTIQSLRTMLAGPRLAALRVHHGDVAGPATWPAILTRDQHDGLRAMLGNPRVHVHGRPPTSLLGGLLRCGRCGGRLHHSRRSGGARRYVCNLAPADTGCGGVAVAAEPVEDVVADAVIEALDSPALTAELSRAEQAPTVDVAAIEERLDELADAYASGEITKREWLRARSKLEERLAEATREREQTATNVTLTPYAQPGALATAWPTLPTEDRRSVITAVLDRIVVERVGPGWRGDPGARLQLVWKA